MVIGAERESQNWKLEMDIRHVSCGVHVHVVHV